MNEIATRHSWNVLPEPVLREWFELPLQFSLEEGEKLRRGYVPRVMEDRWFVFCENEWLYFCRSWSGACIYGVRLPSPPEGATASRCWASRDPEHYHNADLERDMALLRDLLDFILEYDESGEAW